MSALAGAGREVLTRRSACQHADQHGNFARWYPRTHQLSFSEWTSLPALPRFLPVSRYAGMTRGTCSAGTVA